MDRHDRRAAVAAYKERKVAAGIFSIRCEPSGACWIGSSPNLDAVQNRITFELTRGQHRTKGLQAAWNEHGAKAFAFAPLEQIDHEPDIYLRNAVLKDRLAAWKAKLGVETI